MKNLKKIVALGAVLVLAISSLVGCGGSSSEEDTTIKVAATPNPHAVVLEKIKDTLADEGYTLEIVEFEITSYEACCTGYQNIHAVRPPNT